MHLLICIDDTDNLESRGTALIAWEMMEMIERKGWGKCGFASRHHLLLHQSIPYTSHNSCKCFDAKVKSPCYEELECQLTKYLKEESALGSDPGICIANVDNINNFQELIEFGFCTKSEVMSKEQAYHIAGNTGVFLREEGGSGQGIIGALAGVGLRLSGNDGEITGTIEHLIEGKCFTVGELLKDNLISLVCTTDMKPLRNDELVRIRWMAKPMIYHSMPVLIVVSNEEGEWQTMEFKDLRHFSDERTNAGACANFRLDIAEEMVSNKLRTCFNCAYRRWTEKSFSCALKDI